MLMEMVRRPDLFLLEESEDDPLIVLGLPLSAVRAVIDCLYRHGTPAAGLDSSVIDELINQLQEEKERLDIED